MLILNDYECKNVAGGGVVIDQYEGYAKIGLAWMDQFNYAANGCSFTLSVNGVTNIIGSDNKISQLDVFSENGIAIGNIRIIGGYHSSAEAHFTIINF